ncbi:MAG: Uma2 family endonuclease [Isosphaeraceae bacterium]
MYWHIVTLASREAQGCIVRSRHGPGDAPGAGLVPARSPCRIGVVRLTIDLPASRVEGETTRMSSQTPAGSPRRTLVEDQWLDQGAFHALYEAMPPDTRAELINGVVYLPGPIGTLHSRANVPTIVWLGEYAEKTPSVQVLPHVTTCLGWKSEFEPDVQLRMLEEPGGRTREENNLLRGVPDLVLEVAETTRSSTWDRNWTNTSGPACGSTSYARLIPTRCFGSRSGKGDSST